MPGLLELQQAFAASLRGAPCEVHDWAASDGIVAAARLRVYRNNSQILFEQALAATYGVVRERVGDDYFRQLAHFYRLAHPSTSGDLHGVGRQFPGFLVSHLALTPYAWLAELAALEWAVAEAEVAPDESAASIRLLAGAMPERIGDVGLKLVPSLRRLSASVPVVTVWRRSRENGTPSGIDAEAGPEFALVHRASSGVQVRGVQQAEFAFVDALACGATLGAAVDASSLPPDRLAQALHALFEDEAVAEVFVPSSVALKASTAFPT